MNVFVSATTISLSMRNALGICARGPFHCWMLLFEISFGFFNRSVNNKLLSIINQHSNQMEFNRIEWNSIALFALKSLKLKTVCIPNRCTIRRMRLEFTRNRMGMNIEFMKNEWKTFAVLGIDFEENRRN